MAPICATFRECGSMRAKIAPLREEQKVEKKIIAKDTNCNVRGIQPCCSMIPKAFFDGFAHQCLVLIEKQQENPLKILHFLDHQRHMALNEPSGTLRHKHLQQNL